MRSVLCLQWLTAIALTFFLAHGVALGQGTGPEPSLTDWLKRVHQASRHMAYTGTFVVSSSGGMASAKIWHICDGTQQIERVVSLTGAPRTTYRHNDRVVTFFPESKRAVVESRESLGLFPGFLIGADSAIEAFYQLRSLGDDRIAGFDARVVQLIPVDKWRYGFKVWNEKKTGLVMQLQTLGIDGQVLEQSAFSELQLDAPVRMGPLVQQMVQTDAYRVERPERTKVSAEAQSWIFRSTLPGFKTMGCYQRPVQIPAGAVGVDGSQRGLQWVFSDGLASVSVFADSYDGRRHVREGEHSLGGATHAVTRRVGDSWVTAVGEVPLPTLNAFVQGLERKK